jgi:hypothetical protein
MTVQDYDLAQALQAERRADAGRRRLATEAFRNSSGPLQTHSPGTEKLRDDSSAGWCGS